MIHFSNWISHIEKTKKLWFVLLHSRITHCTSHIVNYHPRHVQRTNKQLFVTHYVTFYVTHRISHMIHIANVQEGRTQLVHNCTITRGSSRALVEHNWRRPDPAFSSFVHCLLTFTALDHFTSLITNKWYQTEISCYNYYKTRSAKHSILFQNFSDFRSPSFPDALPTQSFLFTRFCFHYCFCDRKDICYKKTLLQKWVLAKKGIV